LLLKKPSCRIMTKDASALVAGISRRKAAFSTQNGTFVFFASTGAGRLQVMRAGKCRMGRC